MTFFKVTPTCGPLSLLPSEWGKEFQDIGEYPWSLLTGYVRKAIIYGRIGLAIPFVAEISGMSIGVYSEGGGRW